MSCPRPEKECNEFMCGSSIDGICKEVNINKERNYMDKNNIYKEGITILNESLEWAEEYDGKYYVGYVAGVIELINALTKNRENEKNN